MIIKGNHMNTKQTITNKMQSSKLDSLLNNQLSISDKNPIGSHDENTTSLSKPSTEILINKDNKVNYIEFDNTNKCIALQIVSGREGISLKNAKYLVYYNIDFSATSYWQSRDRLTTMQRQSNEIFWIFSKGGIELDIYKTVLKKKDYTLKIFKENERTITI